MGDRFPQHGCLISLYRCGDDRVEDFVHETAPVGLLDGLVVDGPAVNVAQDYAADVKVGVDLLLDQLDAFEGVLEGLGAVGRAIDGDDHLLGRH